jgi:hypothetical protein
MENNTNVSEVKNYPQGSDFIRDAVKLYCKKKLRQEVVDIVEVGPGLFGIKIHYTDIPKKDTK